MMKKLLAVVFFVFALAWIAGTSFTVSWTLPETKGTFSRADMDQGLQVVAGAVHTASSAIYGKATSEVSALWGEWKSPERQRARAQVRAELEQKAQDERNRLWAMVAGK
jgi:hypothetical protein